MGLFSTPKKRAKSPASQLKKLKGQINREKMKAEVRKAKDDLAKLKMKG